MNERALWIALLTSAVTDLHWPPVLPDPPATTAAFYSQSLYHSWYISSRASSGCYILYFCRLLLVLMLIISNVHHSGHCATTALLPVGLREINNSTNGWSRTHQINGAKWKYG